MSIYEHTLLQDVDLRIWIEVPMSFAKAYGLYEMECVAGYAPNPEGKKYTWDDLEREYYESRAKLEPFLDWFWNHEY